MLHLSWLVAATLALLPALAAAQQDQQPPNPLDPAHPVPQVSWRSVFERYQYSPDEKETPEKRWLGVNQQLMPRGKPAAQAAPAAPTARPPEADHQHMHGGH